MTKRIMTPEIRKAMSGLLPFAPGASVPFTPEAFQKVEEALRPVFCIRPYDEKDRKYMGQHIDSGTYDKGCIALAMENSGVTGWSNLCSYPDGDVVPFGKGILETLPDAVFYDLHAKISEFTIGPNKVEKEALVSPLPSTSEPMSNPAQSAGVALP